ncbi:MAG: hypothetical protein PW789_17580 [Edaphobacter sp.]|uniref:hypothetical protein n=1 Tax=Edaphobacter sp. TaxID=1934404 RepID=UPI0023A6FEA4|nr:hypothetical protein [Edaphobacter sp.]MDE1178389.1 hypothetical protein [Edaphobacter sp.]
MLFVNRRASLAAVPPQASMADALTWATGTYELPQAALNPPVVTTTKRLCGSVLCTTSRISPFRSRKRPIFEEQWGCSGRCVLAMVQAAVRREIAGGLETSVAQHRHRLPLGLLMLGQGWITQAQLQYALAVQKLHGGRIGDWLVAECGVAPEHVTRGLSLQWSCPVLTARGFSPAAMALIVPKLFVEEFGLVPLRIAGSQLLYVGFEERLDASAARGLEQMMNLKVESGLVGTLEYSTIRQSLLSQLVAPAKCEVAADADALAARITAILEQKQPIGAKVVRMHRYLWLRLWLEKASRASRGAAPRDHEDILDYIFTVGR